MANDINVYIIASEKLFNPYQIGRASYGHMRGRSAPKRYVTTQENGRLSNSPVICKSYGLSIIWEFFYIYFVFGL